MKRKNKNDNQVDFFDKKNIGKENITEEWVDDNTELNIDDEENRDNDESMNKFIRDVIDNDDADKSIRDIIDREILTDEKLQKEILNYIDKKIAQEIKLEINKQLGNIKVNRNKNLITTIEEDMDSQVINNISESNNDIYIHNIDFTNYEINTALDEIIEDNNFKYNKIAEKMGINRATLANICDNPNSTSLTNAFKISRLLGISIEEIFFYREEK